MVRNELRLVLAGAMYEQENDDNCIANHFEAWKSMLSEERYETRPFSKVCLNQQLARGRSTCPRGFQRTQCKKAVKDAKAQTMLNLIGLDSVEINDFRKGCKKSKLYEDMPDPQSHTNDDIVLDEDYESFSVAKLCLTAQTSGGVDLLSDLDAADALEQARTMLSRRTDRGWGPGGMRAADRPCFKPCDRCTSTEHLTENCPHFSSPHPNVPDAHLHLNNPPPREKDDGNNVLLLDAIEIPQPRDGDYLFHSLAAGMKSWNIDTTGPELRQELNNWLRINATVEVSNASLATWIQREEDKTVDEYCNAMVSNTKWGGAIELRVFAMCKDTDVHVFEKTARW